MDTTSPFFVPALASPRGWVMTPAKGDGPLPTPAMEPNDSHHQLLSVPSISESSSAKAPTLPKKEMKKTACLTPAKRWGNFQRQAWRRKKAVALTEEEYLRLVAQPCVFCSAREKIGVDRVRNSESYTRENAAPCCGRCNMAKRDMDLRAFVSWARDVAKATRPVGPLEGGSTSPL